MKNLAGKQLIILGGNQETGRIVELANSFGVYTIVVDPNPAAPAKQFASEHHEIDGYDVERIVQLAQNLKVDGVMVGVADVLVSPYQQICERLQFPCYASKESVTAFNGKKGFKYACRHYGVQDIPGIIIEDKVSADDLLNVELPVMIKPVDNGGGVGMRICHDLSEIGEHIETALSHSKQSKILLEQYMSGDDMFAYYTFKDGKAYLSATADRITSKTQGELSPVCIAARYPSKHTDEYVKLINPKLLRMFEGLAVRDGVLLLQFFVEGDSFFAYDPGFRLQGEAPHVYLQEINGFDHRKMLIHFSLTGSMGTEDLDEMNDVSFHGKVAVTFWVLLKPGHIQEISGLDEIRNDPCVITIFQRLVAGNHVDPEMLGTERQVLARIYVVTNSIEELVQKSEEYRSKLKVVDEQGNNMLLEWVDPSLLLSMDEGLLERGR